MTKKATVSEACDRMIDLKLRMDDLYSEGDLVGMGGYSPRIQVTADFLRRMPGKAKKQYNAGYRPPAWTYLKVYQNVPFFAMEEQDIDIEDGGAGAIS